MVSQLSLHSIRLFYAAYFAAMGLILPYFPLYLTDLGLNSLWVGIFVGTLAATKVIAPPLAGLLLELRNTSTRTFLLIAASLSTFASALLIPQFTLQWMLAIVIIFGLLWASMLPLTDGISLLVSEISMMSYGRLRVWGSVGFVLTSFVGGIWLVGESIHFFPYLLTALLLLTSIAALGFPNLHDLQQHPSQQNTSHSHANNKALAWLLVTAFCMQASHGAYYGFFSLYMLDIGFSGSEIGMFWILGVIAEIILMWYWSKPIQRANPVWMLGLCLLLAALRWFGLAFTTSLTAIIALQLLHAATFAAFHLSAVAWVHQFSSPKRQTSAQGWYSSIGFGLGSTVGIMACGYIIEQQGYPIAFVSCGVIAILGLLAVAQLHKHLFA
ncbi:MAG: MFS transporter, partial [Ghiorsea sp.]